jgi:hypothetical protein
MMQLRVTVMFPPSQELARGMRVTVPGAWLLSVMYMLSRLTFNWSLGKCREMGF